VACIKRIEASEHAKRDIVMQIDEADLADLVHEVRRQAGREVGFSYEDAINYKNGYIRDLDQEWVKEWGKQWVD
jgi:hypothetical protein